MNVLAIYTERISVWLCPTFFFVDQPWNRSCLWHFGTMLNVIDFFSHLCRLGKCLLVLMTNLFNTYIIFVKFGSSIVIEACHYHITIPHLFRLYYFWCDSMHWLLLSGIEQQFQFRIEYIEVTKTLYILYSVVWCGMVCVFGTNLLDTWEPRIGPALHCSTAPNQT